MSPDPASPDYCPVHGIKAMLTDEGVATHMHNLPEAILTVNAHLARCTPVKIAKLPGLSKRVHRYAARAMASEGGALTLRVAYFRAMAAAIDAKLARVEAERA